MVIGFPLLTAFAIKCVPAAHGAVVAGLLPAMTVVMAVLRSGERPPDAFWLALGGMARVGQMQLLQPVLTLLWAALFLGEVIDLPTALAGLLVVASVALTRLSWGGGRGRKS